MQYLKIEVSVETKNIGGDDPDDYWSRNSTTGDVDVVSVSIIEEDSYDMIATDDNYKVGDTVYILHAVYTTGDSFGRDGGNYELLGAYKTLDAAKSALVHFENINDYSVPWIGYFESLDNIKITELEIL